MINFKYRIYPNKEQEAKLLTTLTTCRYTYNNALAERIEKYKADKTHVSYFDQTKTLTASKNEYQVNVNARVLTDTLRRLDKSFKRFFDGLKKGVRVGFPRFKTENRFRSFCYSQNGFKIINNGTHIRLSKIGDVKIKLSREVQGKIKTCIVLKDVDQWFVVLACEQGIQKPIQNNKPSVGIDVGIEKLATLSDGSIIKNPRTFAKSQDKLAKAQRSLSRKKKGSKNRNKQRIKVAKLHRKIRRQRDDFLHKTSTHFATNYGTIVFEDLNINGMLKNHYLAKHISDAGWGKLILLTTYKAASAGGQVVKVDAKYTSQDCSGCGERVSKTLAERTHSCPHCGLVMDRDENAAINIKNRAGSAQIHAQGDNVRPKTNS